jgi:hypothetical protein
MSLSNIIKGLLNLQKKVDVKILPSQGLFYKNDFEIWVKKADIGDIIEYEYNYIKDDLGIVLSRLKRIVENNTILSPKYSFSDIKSIDIVFLFLEIVKFTKNKPIKVSYFNDEIGKPDVIEFDKESFNYFKIEEKIMKFYNEEEKLFIIDGYKYTLPSIGVENCLTNFLLSKQYESDALKYNDYSYEFMNFLGEKNNLTFYEIDNLLQIFNFDLEYSERSKVRKICKTFSYLHKYALKKGKRIIDINSKIDLEKIWK